MPFVLCVGQGSPRKNHVRAIKAFLKAFSPNDPVGLILVRRLDRPDPALSLLLKDPDVQQRVIFLDYIDREMLRALYRKALLFFFPSYVEGFGLPLWEAMACGCPTVTANRGAMKEVAGKASLLCSPFSLAEMSNALRKCGTDPLLRHKLINAGYHRILDYTVKEAALKTLQVYDELARR